MAHGLTYSFPFSDAFVASLQLLYAKLGLGLYTEHPPFESVLNST